MYPLTGLPVEDETAVGRPALVIPVDNWGPQGPHAGLNEMVLAALRDVGWTVFDQGSPGFFRSDEFGNFPPQNLYANTTELWAQAGDSGVAVPQFGYLPDGRQIDGTEVNEIAIQFGNNPIVWTWHAGTGRYLRSQFDHVHETSTGQATATTVIVVEVPYRDSQPGAGSPEAQTVGSGRVLVFGNGRRVEGTWTRESPTSPFTLQSDGKVIRIPPGRTWSEVLDVDDYQLTES